MDDVFDGQTRPLVVDKGSDSLDLIFCQFFQLRNEEELRAQNKWYDFPNESNVQL